VASNVSSLPEVLGEAAEYVNPEFVPGIASGIVRVLSDAGRREALTAKGLRRAEQFSWDQAARQTLEMYEATV
jgi:glycosyltransferase involved in cell wall biosynthesis